MARVIFVQPDGSERTLDIGAGEILMKAAVNAGIDGIVAECGGACACATCQVIVPDEWRDALDPPAAMEQSMLDDEDHGRRLSCQIEVTEAMDGLTVCVPPSQH